MDTLPITTPRQAGIYVRQAREAQGSLVRPSLKKPVFRSACSHRSSWATPRAFGSTSY